MEDYREKIEKLPPERLRNLIAAYRITIRKLEEYNRDANTVAFLNVADYTGSELAKKKAELAEIEKILEHYNQEELKKSGE
jgi:hypothetical protein